MCHNKNIIAQPNQLENTIDGATNQPNVFYDPESSESALPYHSLGRVDIRAQRMGLVATEQVWASSSMVTERFLWTWDARPYPYWPDRLDVWADGGNWAFGHWVQGKLGMSGLGAVIAEICLQSGLAVTDVDVTALDGLLEGFVLAEIMTGRAAIEILQQGYFFDAVESEGVLKFLPRGQAAVANIPATDCLSDRQEPRTSFSVTRRQEVELPQRVEVTYLNRLAAYQAGIQVSQRQVTDALEVTQISMPIVFPDQEAKVIADRHLLRAWVERLRYQLAVSTKYAAIEPADVVTVSDGNTTHTLRILSVRQGRDGTLLWEAVAEDSTAYDVYSTAGVASTQVGIPQLPGETQVEFLDIPALPNDTADTMRLRVAANSADDGWRGMVLYRSDDGGQDYHVVLGTEQAAVIGTAVDALADGVVHQFDERNSVTVVLMGDGELASASRDAVLSGANLALLGEEVIQFSTATMVESGKYTLSGLLRGRLGTEHQTTTHAVGEQFVLLNGQVQGIDMPVGLLGLPRLYKPVSIGATLGSTTAESTTYQGKALQPYAPVHLTGSRDGAGNLTLNWVRRTRVGGQWRDFADIPLSEETEAYEVDILDGATVVRTISVAGSSTAFYTAIDQTTDFGSTQSSVSLKIYQLSSLVGRGIAADAVL